MITLKSQISASHSLSRAVWIKPQALYQYQFQ